jgi:hypothetical protein
MVDFFLSHTKFTVKILQLAANWPKFKDLQLLPSRFQSVVSEEAFRVFVSALSGTKPALTTKNLNGLRLFYEDLGFAILRFKVSAFKMRPSVVDAEAQTGLRNVTESTLAIKRSIFLLGRELWNSGQRIRSRQPESGHRSRKLKSSGLSFRRN